VEAEWLESAQKIDQMYHMAKLIAAAFNQPERIWSEHEQVRDTLLRANDPTQPAPMTDAQLMEAVARIHRKMQGAGLVKPTSGVMN
jgi:hypothetical protein